MILRQVLFSPNHYYVLFTGGGNRRILWTDGAEILLALVDPNGNDRSMRLSLLRKDLDLPYGVDWSTGPWHFGGTEYEWVKTNPSDRIIGMNDFDGIDTVPTVADGLGLPLDRSRYGV